MSRAKILKNTSSYHDELIESLKDSKEADVYLKIAMEEYQDDGDTDALLARCAMLQRQRGDE